MYARRVKDKSLSFGVSGMLWENSLVMIDDETKSLWSHILGECMRGPMVGEKLEVIPSLMTDWGTWKKRYPDTTMVVMQRSSQNYLREMFTIDTGLVIGITDGKRTRYWPLDGLKGGEPVNDEFGDLPVLVVFDTPSYTARLFSRRLDDAELTFSLDAAGELVDDGGSRWDWLNGAALEGPRKGQRLRPLPGVISDNAVWELYHSHTALTGWFPSEGQ